MAPMDACHNDESLDRIAEDGLNDKAANDQPKYIQESTGPHRNRKRNNPRRNSHNKGPYDKHGKRKKSKEKSTGGSVPKCDKCHKFHGGKFCWTTQPKTCFNCGKPGHISPYCPEKNKNPGDSVPKCDKCHKFHGGRNCWTVNPPTCYTCGKKGHINRFCPEGNANLRGVAPKPNTSVKTFTMSGTEANQSENLE